MPDFLNPGYEGTLPPGVNQWRRGLVYLAKREIPSPIVIGQEYKIMVGFKQKVSQPFSGYHDVFGRVTQIANWRVSRMSAEEAAEPIHVWTIAQGWLSLPMAPGIAVAFMTLGLISPHPGDDVPRGEAPPGAQALTAPGGAPQEQVPVDEIYNAFDFGDPENAESDPVMVSYGESVPSCEGINFQPFVQRADRLANFYRDLLPGGTSGPLRVIRRSWYSLTNPNLVTVEIHFEEGGRSTGYTVRL